MLIEPTASSVLVPMQQETVALLLAQRIGDDGSLDHVVLRLLHERADAQVPAVDRAPPPSFGTRGKWQAKAFGRMLTAESLGRLFAEIMDVVHDLDPAILERFSHRGGRTRRFISRAKEGVHGGRLDLSLVRTRSGWWVSGCVSARDVRRALEALCGEAELVFGRDVQLPIPGAGD